MRINAPIEIIDNAHQLLDGGIEVDPSKVALMSFFYVNNPSNFYVAPGTVLEVSVIFANRAVRQFILTEDQALQTALEANAAKIGVLTERAFQQIIEKSQKSAAV